MPGTAMAATKHPHSTKHQRNPSKLSQNSRSGSSTKLQPGHGHNLAFAAIKIAADHGPPTRVDSSQTIRTDSHAAGAAREYGHSRSNAVGRPTVRQVSQTTIKKPKFAMPVETQDVNVVGRTDGYDEDDDDENWVSSGVVTPDNRGEADAGHTTPQTRLLPGLPALLSEAQQCQQLPASGDCAAGPSSVPTSDSLVLGNHRNAGANDILRHQSSGHNGGYKTAPSSRPPSVQTKRHRGPPSLIRTSSFTPALNTTAPPLTTTSVANAQITSTNPPEDKFLTSPTSDISVQPSVWDGTAALSSSPPVSPTSPRAPQSRSTFLPPRTTGAPSTSGFRRGLIRTPTQSSVSTLAVRESQQVSPRTSLNTQLTTPVGSSADLRNRKLSTFSVASGKLGAVTSSIAGLIGRGSVPSIGPENPCGNRPSAAMSSLQAIPKRRDTPPPLTSHFPPESQIAHVSGGTAGAGGSGGMAFSLLPAPYMASHMAVRAYEAPLQDAYARVVLSRPKPLSSTSRS